MSASCDVSLACAAAGADGGEVEPAARSASTSFPCLIGERRRCDAKAATCSCFCKSLMSSAPWSQRQGKGV